MENQEKKTSPNIIIAIVLVLAVLIGGAIAAVLFTETDNNEDSTNNAGEVENNPTGNPTINNETSDLEDFNPTHSGLLEDVTNGDVVRGITTNGNASGNASFSYDSINGYELYASFENLPEPAGTDFYEGWIVRPEPFDFISTGELNKVNGSYMNTFTSDIDYSEYINYVLTLEPDDGDPAPADHIVEGTMEMLSDNIGSMAGTGQYLDYSKTNLEKAQANGDVVLLFAADWCSTCRRLESNISEMLDTIPADLTILRVPYDKASNATDEELDLKKEYGVVIQHTLVQVDADGNELTQWSGTYSIDEIIQRLV